MRAPLVSQPRGWGNHVTLKKRKLLEKYTLHRAENSWTARHGQHLWQLKSDFIIISVTKLPFVLFCTSTLISFLLPAASSTYSLSTWQSSVVVGAVALGVRPTWPWVLVSLTHSVPLASYAMSPNLSFLTFKWRKSWHLSVDFRKII